MAGDRGQGSFSITIEPVALRNLIATLNMMDKESQNRVRDAAQPLSARLAGQLMQAADSAPTPQARLVALSIKTPRDRLIRVDIGGTKKVGRKYGGVASKSGKGSKVKMDSAPAGALLWGSEHGSNSGTDRAGRAYTNRFKVGASQRGYWITPTVDDYAPIVAAEYVSIVKGIINDLELN